MRISDWSSDVCSSDLAHLHQHAIFPARHVVHPQARREAVIGNVAAWLSQQGFGHGLEGLDGGVAEHQDRKSVVEGKGVSVTCRSRSSPSHYKKKRYNRFKVV